MNFFENFNEKKNFILNKKNFYFILSAIIIFTFDRYSKNKIIYDFNENTYFINNFINFELMWNTGIGFGLLSSNSLLFYNSISILIGLVILILLYVSIFSETFDKFIFSMIVGGAIGNFYDRIVFNAVPDFIDLHYENFHWFTFNVADIFITIGIIAFLVKGFLLKK